jgi:uncharacterized protein
MAKKEDIKIVKTFKERLQKVIPIQKIILFGSRAKGKIHEWSDFDLMVVSKSFKGKKSFKRAIGFHNHWDFDYPVDFLCYTPEEFNKLKNQITIVREAVNNGIEIK